MLLVLMILTVAAAPLIYVVVTDLLNWLDR